MPETNAVVPQRGSALRRPACTHHEAFVPHEECLPPDKPEVAVTLPGCAGLGEHQHRHSGWR